MKKLIIVFVTSMLVTKLNAQTVEPSSGIEKNNIQLELESLYSTQKEGAEKITSWSVPSLLLRYGLSKSIELQLNTPIIKEQLYNDNHLIHSLYKFDDIQLGFAINLWKQKKILPETSLMFRAIIPVNLKLNTKNIGKILALNFSHQIDSKFNFSNNIGYVTEITNKTTGFYISNLTFELNPKVHFFVENFGDFTEKKLISSNLNIGAGYNLNSNLSVDISMANGLNHNLFYVGGVLTWVFNLTKN